MYRSKPQSAPFEDDRFRSKAVARIFGKIGVE